MGNFLTLNGQSNYDLCLKATGGFNGFIKFCNNNSIKDISFPPLKVFFNNNDIENKILAGKNYSTKTVSPRPLLDNNGQNLLDNDGSQLFDNS